MRDQGTQAQAIRFSATQQHAIGALVCNEGGLSIRQTAALLLNLLLTLLLQSGENAHHLRR
jgi:hypothetical protein